MFIEKIDVSNFIENSFVKSLIEYNTKHKTITQKQRECLLDLTGTKEDISDIKNLEYTTVTVLLETYNHLDYHGDYFLRTQEAGFVGNQNFDEEIQDYNAQCHKTTIFVKKYSKGREVSIPNILSINGFYVFDNFLLALKKINTDRSSVKNFNRAVRLARKCLNLEHISDEDVRFLKNLRPKSLYR